MNKQAIIYTASRRIRKLIRAQSRKNRFGCNQQVRKERRYILNALYQYDLGGNKI